MNTSGAWQIADMAFNGGPLWFVWFLEAAIIIGIPIALVVKHPVIPFSEDLGKWYNKYIFKFQFENISRQALFRRDLEENVKTAISNLSYGQANRYAEVSIYYLKNEKTQYLSVENIYIEDAGKGSKDKSSVIHLLEIETELADFFMEKFGKKREFILDY